MSRGGISRADLLRALVRKSALSAEEINSLGFDPEKNSPKEPEAKQKEPPDPLHPKKGADPVYVLPETAKPLEPVEFWVPVSFEADEIDLPPTEADNASAIEMPVRPDSQKVPQYRYLTPFSKLVPRLRAALSEQRPSRAYDIKKIVEKVGRAEILHRLPRKHRAGWGSNLYVIEDRSDHLAPYIQDQAMVQSHLQKLYVKTGFFTAIYSELCDWPLVYRDDGVVERLEPKMGDQILVLGDLGLLLEDGGRVSQFWQRFGLNLHERGATALALLPCAPDACPAELSSFYQLLSWEHPAADVLADDELLVQGEILLNHLAISSRIEPGLLREVRFALGVQQFPARLESWVWQHEVMDEADVVATSLLSEKVVDYRQRYCRDEVNRKETLLAAKAWLSDLPYEIWLESVFNLRNCDWTEGVITHQDREDAELLIKYLASRAVDRGVAGLGSRAMDWLEGFKNRLDERGIEEERKEVRDAYWSIKSALEQRKTDFPLQLEHQLGRYRFTHDSAKFSFQSLEDAARQKGSLIAQLDSLDRYIEIKPHQGSTEVSSQPSWAVDSGQDQYGQWAEFVYKNVRQRMRWIEPGEFLMGSPPDEHDRQEREGPQHQVILEQGYWLFDTACTQALWVAVMGNNPSRFKGENHPVENVSWNDCQQFFNKINQAILDLELSLPSEAQWEYTCRAGTNTPFSFGETIDPDKVNYDGNYPYREEDKKGQYRQETLSAKALPVNPWGLYQMHGNVWEWVDDVWHESYESAPEDGAAWVESGGENDDQADLLRVFRGGSWSDRSHDCRCSYRDGYGADYNGLVLGFRPARVQDPSGS